MIHTDILDLSRTEGDWILGGLGAFVPENLNPQANWLPYLPPFKIQRAKDGDTFACTVFSAWSALWMIHKIKFGQDLDKSESFTAVDAGNKPGIGNSFNATDESIRLHWSVSETEKPFDSTMTLAQFYAPNTSIMTQDALNDLKQYSVQHSWLSTVIDQNYSSPDQINQALKSSPVRCGVDGDYHADGITGLIYNNPNPRYDHAVDIVYQRPSDGAWAVFDSERMSLDWFKPDYQFTGCKIYSLEKKSLPNFLHRSDGSMVFLAKAGAFAGQYIGAGNGDTMLAIWGSYMKDQRTEVTDFPSNYTPGRDLFIKE